MRQNQRLRNKKPTNGRFLGAYALNDEIANAYDHLTPPDYPIAYKAGRWFFCGLPLFVNEHVLIPRMDTELLVEKVIASVAKQSQTDPQILDVGTGSGCIAIALAKKMPDAKITAVDVSEKALKVARHNAKLNKVNIKFIKTNFIFFRELVAFDVIVSNPPYIKTAEIGKHDKSILHEPKIALDGGKDGLDFYRYLAMEAQVYLKPGGLLALEIGHDQGESVKTLLQEWDWCDIKVYKDANGQDRVVTAKCATD